METPETFFTFDKDFLHRSLWKERDFIWGPIASFVPYIESLPLGDIRVEIPQGVFLENPEKISIGEGTKIEPGVFLKGPCFIGKGCTIGHGAYLREGTILSDYSEVGHASEVKNSLLFPFAKASHFVYLGDSIVGRKVNLGAGVKCANVRLDKKEIFVRFGGKKMGTGTHKMGAIIGDESQVGCNAVLSPGALLTKKTLLAPLTHFVGSSHEYSQV